MKIYVVRHGETNYNVLNLCNQDPGADCHLTDRGKQQARVVAEKLGGIVFDAVYISQFDRTKETAEIITNIDMIVDERLGDRLVGDEFEGKPVSDFKKALEHDRLNAKLPGGESFYENKDRVNGFINDLLKTQHRNVLIVTHQNNVKIIAGYFKKLDDNEIRHLPIDNCDVFVFSRSDT